MRKLFGIFQRMDFLIRAPWSRMWLGLPAAAFVLGSIITSVSYGVASPQSPDAVIKRAKVEMSQNRLNEARIILERFLASESEDEDVLHLYAAVLAALGQPERGISILHKLAPENNLGHIPSQVALAQWTIRQPNISLAELKIAENRLNRVLSIRRDHPEARLIMADLHLQYASRTQNPEERTSEIKNAINLYASLAGDGRPWLGQPLGELYTVLKDETSARRWFQTAGQHFKSQVNSNVDDHPSRVAWARTHLWMKDFDQAFDILSEGLTVAMSDNNAKIKDTELSQEERDRKTKLITEYRVVMADVRAKQVEYLKANDPNNLNDRVSRLSQGLDLNPTNQTLLQNMVELSESNTPQSAQMATKLKELQVKGTNNSALHFVLGVNAFLKNQHKQASFHFERAFEIDPSAPSIANNLAYLVAQQENPDLPRARTLIDAAIEKSPDNIDLIDTRGMIRIKQGEFKDGIKDLEVVNQYRGGNLERHELLALAYEKIQDPDTAKLHRKEAQALKNEKQSQPIRSNKINNANPIDSNISPTNALTNPPTDVPKTKPETKSTKPQPATTTPSKKSNAPTTKGS